MITVDSRVGTSTGKSREQKMAEWLRDFKRAGIPAEEGHLEYGDFAWTGNFIEDRPVRVGLELKTIPDLVGSIHSGRLGGHQLPGMTRVYEFRYLLVEGAMKVNLDGLLLQPRYRDWVPTRPPIMYREVANFLNSAELLGGFHVRRSWTSMETASMIAGLYRWWQKPWEQHNSLDYQGRVRTDTPIMFTKPNQVQKFALTLPGIGAKTAYNIARVFHTPLELAQASVEELAAVPGMGAKTAKKAHEAIRKERI